MVVLLYNKFLNWNYLILKYKIKYHKNYLKKHIKLKDNQLNIDFDIHHYILKIQN